MFGMLGKGYKKAYGASARTLGKMGNTEGMTRRQMLQRGRRRTNAAIGVGGGAMVLRQARSSSGVDGIQPHSMGGTTGFDELPY